MKNLKFIAFTIAILFVATSCNKDNPITPPVAVKYKTITNLYAPQVGGRGRETGAFTKFSFKKGTTVTGNDWDIAFRATTIIVNGGDKIGGLDDEPERTGKAAITVERGIFSSVTTAPSDTKFKQDGDFNYALSKGVWYSYNRRTHIISVVEGIILVIKTYDGHYAKMKILNYYKDMPAKPNKDTNKPRYYTFNYIYNSKKGDKIFQ